MKLLNKELLEKLPNLYDTEEIKNPVCHVKLFTPDSSWTWYIIEISKENENTCYGYIQGLENELGYFNLSELESLKGPLGLEVERDLSFKPIKLSIIKKMEL
ncbi:MAG: hypothetical protein CL623_08195 [Arcobacter sp.]|nr:hypothetical protein [Arcobacter sp.]|tara:strand:- start:18177 stop:18482 length:306 start_codon:yes stop_codon:yes gene_type:complete